MVIILDSFARVRHNKKDLIYFCKGEKFTFNSAAAQAFVFFGAGFETSSITLQFALYQMALHQDIQDRVRAEIKAIMAKHEGNVTYEAVEETVGSFFLKGFSQNIIKNEQNVVFAETLRLYPPLPVLNRSCVKDYAIPGSDVAIEKGAKVLIPALGLHMDERYFPNPEKLDPERFTEEQKQERHKFVYLPFGQGPRICIGKFAFIFILRVCFFSV